MSISSSHILGIVLLTIWSSISDSRMCALPQLCTYDDSCRDKNSSRSGPTFRLFLQFRLLQGLISDKMCLLQDQERKSSNAETQGLSVPTKRTRMSKPTPQIYEKTMFSILNFDPIFLKSHPPFSNSSH